MSTLEPLQPHRQPPSFSTTLTCADPIINIDKVSKRRQSKRAQWVQRPLKMFIWRTTTLILRKSVDVRNLLRIANSRNISTDRIEDVDPDSMRASSRQNSLEKTANTWQKYKYAPLPTTEGSMRLMRLYPAPDSSKSWPIRCSLFTTTLDQAPPYVALSYSWGEQMGSQIVLVDSLAMAVTPNLKNALQRLTHRNGEPELILWIDAICINQEDIQERNTQTANMRSIYQHASSVAVWLGLQSHGSKDAIELARALNECPKAKIRELLRNPENKERLDGLVALFRRQYWWRIWVIQEVSSARYATVYCGDESIPWSELENVCDIMKAQEDLLESIYYKFPSFPRTLTDGGPRGLQLSRYSPGATTPPLLELLISHKSKKSTDPRDKVYALVGISESRYTFGTIDYSLSMRDAYTHTAHHIITTSKKLDVICVKQHDINQFGLPSWAPDWTRPPPNSGATMIGLHHHKPPFAAAGTTTADVHFHTKSILKTKGIVIDTIASVGMPFKKRGLPSDAGSVMRQLEVFHDWWNIFVAVHSNSLTSQARFGRAISCGNWNFERDEMYANNLEAIFALSDDMLSESDLLRLNPPTRTNTMESSISTLVDEEEGDVNGEEKTRISAIVSAGLTMNRRRLFLSREGRVGLATQNAAEGDLVCILLGCRFPVILRPHDGFHVVIGEAYVEEFMNGEGIVGLEQKQFTLEAFQIH